MHTFVTGRARARRSTFLAGAAGLLLIASVAACSSGSTNAIFVSGAWARTSSAMASAGAGYLVIKNNGTADDALTGGSSSVAGAVEVHETVDMSSALPSAMPSAGGTGMGGGMASPAASGSMGGTTGGSMMGMQKIDRLVIPAGGSKAGYFAFPNSISKWHLSAMASVLSQASGSSENSARISSADLK